MPVTVPVTIPIHLLTLMGSFVDLGLRRGQNRVGEPRAPRSLTLGLPHLVVRSDLGDAVENGLRVHQPRARAISTQRVVRALRDRALLAQIRATRLAHRDAPSDRLRRHLLRSRGTTTDHMPPIISLETATSKSKSKKTTAEKLHS